MFEWDVLSAYVLFVDPADIERVWSGIGQRWLRLRGTNRVAA
jgi:hypothetical protein